MYVTVCMFMYVCVCIYNEKLTNAQVNKLRLTVFASAAAVLGVVAGHICVRILLYMCSHTCIYASAYHMYTVFASSAAVLGVVAGYIYKYTYILTRIFIHNIYIYTHTYLIYIYVLYIIYIYVNI
jgi:hypothetical protein